MSRSLWDFGDRSHFGSGCCLIVLRCCDGLAGAFGDATGDRTVK
jgi:hypothetical protein